MSTPDAHRQEYTDGLRAIADLFDAHPEVPLPLEQIFNIFVHGDDAASQIAELRREIGGKWEKGASESWFWLRRYFGPHYVDITSTRAEVCTRMVTGTEKVEIPDPDAPTVTVERETYEWVCPSSLDPDRQVETARRRVADFGDVVPDAAEQAVAS